MAHANLLQVVSHHGTDLAIDLDLLCCCKMLRPIRIIIWSMAHAMRSLCKSFQSLLEQLALVPQGLATISSRTGAGTLSGVCRTFGRNLVDTYGNNDCAVM